MMTDKQNLDIIHYIERLEEIHREIQEEMTHEEYEKEGEEEFKIWLDNLVGRYY